MKRQYVGKSVVKALSVFGAATALAQPFPPNPPVTDGTATSQENFNYGVCTGTDPARYPNRGAVRESPPRGLLYTRTAGPPPCGRGTPPAPPRPPPSAT